MQYLKMNKMEQEEFEDLLEWLEDYMETEFKSLDFIKESLC